MKSADYSPRIYCAQCSRNTKLWLCGSIVAACVCFIYWNVLGLMSPEDWSTTFYRASELFGYNPEIHQFKMIHPSFIQYVTQRFLKSPQLEQYRNSYIPSSGALMLLVALHTCDQVSAYGFITENYKDFSCHYYDKVKKPLVLYANHDMEMEGRLWKQLHSQKVLWLYQRQKNYMITRQ